MKYINDNNGFTLVTAIVSMGVMGLVALGFMRLTRMQSKSTKYYETRSNEREVVDNIRLFLRDRQACENTLAGIDAPGTSLLAPLTMIKTSTDLTVFETSNPKKYGLESITMNLRNPFNVGANTRGPFVIEVDFVRSDNAIGIKEKKEEILLDIQTGPAIGPGFDIVTCFTDGENNINTAIHEICLQAGGTPVEIFNAAEIMQNKGIKWRCEFFDLYLGQHNKKQCQQLGGMTYPLNTENPTHCRVRSGTDGWKTATNSWTPYLNFFSATPKPEVDCDNPDDVNVGADALSIADYRALESGGSAGLNDYDISTGLLVSDPCYTRSPLVYADHPQNSENCTVVCSYEDDEDGGTRKNVNISRPMDITSRGFY